MILWKLHNLQNFAKNNKQIAIGSISEMEWSRSPPSPCLWSASGDWREGEWQREEWDAGWSSSPSYLVHQTPRREKMYLCKVTRCIFTRSSRHLNQKWKYVLTKSESKPLPRWPTKLTDRQGQHWQERRCKDSRSISSSMWKLQGGPGAQTGLQGYSWYTKSQDWVGFVQNLWKVPD